MPSQAEWNNLREEFERLYVTQGRTLADVSKRLAERGFHASIKQYKTQIRLWNLRRNNKYSDMVFAKRKLSECDAAGQEISFIINGQARTREDITRYWKRSRKSPPEDIEIHTGPPTPPSVKYLISDLTSNQSPVKSPDVIVPDTKNCSNATSTTVISLPSSLASIRLTGNVRNFEIVIWHARDFFRFCATPNDNIVSLLSCDPTTRQTPGPAVYRLLDCARTLGLRARYGNIPSSTQIALQACEKLVPTIVAARDPNFLVCLFRILSNYCQEGLISQIETFLYMIAQNVSKSHDLLHPILPLALALLRSPQYIPQIAEAILQPRFAELSEKLGPEDPQTISTTHSLAFVYAVNRKQKQSHALTMMAFDRLMKTAPQNMSERTRVCHFSLLARAEFELGRFTDAIQRIEDAMKLSQRIQTDKQWRAASQCSLLVLMGDVQADRGMPEARLSYERALQTAKGVLPLDHPQYLQAAIGLRELAGMPPRSLQISHSRS